VRVLIPIKSPARAKSRLGELLTAAERARLALSMLEDLLERFAGAGLAGDLELLSSDREIADLAQRARVRLRWDPLDGQASVSDVVARALSALARDGEPVVAVLHADLPLVEPGLVAAVETALADLSAPAVAIAADRHRDGTNLLVQRPPGFFAPSYGPGSLERHWREAQRLGAAPIEITGFGLDLDLDTPADIGALLERLDRPASSRVAAPRLRALIGDLGLNERVRSEPKALAKADG
jgi:2-phospho-L-lactate guanylyltransferase